MLKTEIQAEEIIKGPQVILDILEKIKKTNDKKRREELSGIIIQRVINDITLGAPYDFITRFNSLEAVFQDRQILDYPNKNNIIIGAYKSLKKKIDGLQNIGKETITLLNLLQQNSDFNGEKESIEKDLIGRDSKVLENIGEYSNLIDTRITELTEEQG